MGASGLHNDHRARMRDRFRRNGLSGFEDHEILEMMLYSVIPRRNTNDIAHGLLDEFGDIPSVLAADTDLLCTVDGIGLSAAGKIRFLAELYDRVSTEIFGGVSLDSDDRAGMYAMLRMGLAPADSAVAVYLDDAGIRISEEELYRGRSSMTDELQLRIAERAAEIGADGILLMHNHRREPLEASPEDRQITEMLRRKAEALGISRVMHVIVADDGYLLI